MQAVVLGEMRACTCCIQKDVGLAQIVVKVLLLNYKLPIYFSSDGLPVLIYRF